MKYKEFISEVGYEFNGQPRITYRVAGSRVSLNSVVYAYRRGESPEEIVDSFDSLSLEQVNNTITFYLANREEIDEYLRQSEIESEMLGRQLNEKLRIEKPELYQRLMDAKQRSLKSAA
jgi:uncharacterized protein (DUF433 family)